MIDRPMDFSAEFAEHKIQDVCACDTVQPLVKYWLAINRVGKTWDNIPAYASLVYDLDMKEYRVYIIAL